jgi:hemolysin III
MHAHTDAHRYTLAEEIVNAVTHGFGLALASAGLAILVTFAVLRGDVWHIVSTAIFGSMLVVLYAASTLYHSIPHPKAKNVLRVLDHSAIYLLIAGTYTPFTLVNLRGPWGWSLFIVIWSLAVLGVALAPFLKRSKGVVTVILSVLMGWTVVFAFEPLSRTVEPGGIALLVAGGLVYTIGILFYAWKRLPWNHAVWHVFVLGGSVLHFFAVLFYVVPGPAV